MEPSRAVAVPGPTPAPPRPAGALRAAAAGLAGLLLLAPTPLAAQQEPGGIRGVVVDAGRQAPVGHAEVEVPELGRRTLADAEGRFRFRDLPPGSYELRVRFLGYEATVRQVEVPPGATREVELRVAPGPVELEELRVTVRSLTWLPGFRQRRGDRTGHFFTKKQIEEADPDHLTELLRDREGVRIGFNRRGHGPEKLYPQFYYRGPGRRGVFCRPAVFVDGDMMGPGRPYLRFNEIPPERVLAMEVYYRERDVPENIEYDHRGQVSGDDVAGLSEAATSALSGDVGDARRSVPGSGVRDVLASAGMEGIFRSPVPQRDEDLELNRTTLAGLYERMPRIEHCGAIFVWTRLFPLEGR